MAQDNYNYQDEQQQPTPPPTAPNYGQQYGANPGSNGYQQPIRQTIIVQERSSNGVGTTGFVFAIIALVIGWIPLFGQILGGICWLIGAILSLIGVFKRPRGLAIAGLVISFLGLIILLFILGSLGTLALLS